MYGYGTQYLTPLGWRADPRGMAVLRRRSGIVMDMVGDAPLMLSDFPHGRIDRDDAHETDNIYRTDAAGWPARATFCEVFGTRYFLCASLDQRIPAKPRTHGSRVDMTAGDMVSRLQDRLSLQERLCTSIGEDSDAVGHGGGAALFANGMASLGSGGGGCLGDQWPSGAWRDLLTLLLGYRWDIEGRHIAIGVSRDRWADFDQWIMERNGLGDLFSVSHQHDGRVRILRARGDDSVGLQNWLVWWLICALVDDCLGGERWFLSSVLGGTHPRVDVAARTNWWSMGAAPGLGWVQLAASLCGHSTSRHAKFTWNSQAPTLVGDTDRDLREQMLALDKYKGSTEGYVTPLGVEDVRRIGDGGRTVGGGGKEAPLTVLRKTGWRSPRELVCGLRDHCGFTVEPGTIMKYRGSILVA